MNSTKPRNQGSRSYVPKLFSAVVIASMVMAVAMSAAIVDRHGRPNVTLSGTVSDTICGGAHGTYIQGDTECTRECVEMGAGYALVVGKRVYLLRGHTDELDKFAGQGVSVRGEFRNRDTVVVESITPVVVEVLSKMAASQNSKNPTTVSNLSAIKR